MEDPSHAKRRRGLGVVTPNACTECRKKRAKCDGATPCGRCKSQNVGCRYELPVRHSKENMRAELDQLRRQQKQSEKVLAALVSIDKSDNVLEQLRSGETLENISGNLDGERRKSLMLNEVGMSEDNIGSTTFRRPVDQQAILNAVNPTRSQSMGSSPFSAVATSDTPTGSMEQQNMQGQLSWPAWPGGPSSSRQLSNAGQSNDVMRWSPDNLATQGLGYPLVGTWHQQKSDSEGPDSTIQWAREQGRGHILGSQFGVEESQPDDSPHVNKVWTEVTSDGDLVEHLMALYFCWEYPSFASLSKEHFLEDFRAGRRRYCSSLLVNALLAVGCRFSTQVEARVDPENSDTAGDHFFAEALRKLEAETNRHKLTTIQALGLMSIREASCGRSSESVYYAGQSVMIAVEMGLHLESESGGGENASIEHAVKSATFWGAFSLDQAWSICIGRLPHFSKETKLMTKPAIVAHIEKSSWVPYTDDGDINKQQLPEFRALTADPGAPLEVNCTQPSNIRSVYRAFCELSEIIHRALYVFYTPGVPLTGKALLDIYTQYLNWYDGIPDVLRLGQNFTPAVLFAHMYYHFAILLLFRPFIKLDIVNSGVFPRDVCTQAADAIGALVKSYYQLYTLQRTPSFVPYFVLTSSITHLITLGNGGGGPERLYQGISDLKVMSSGHGFARRARDILIFLAYHWEIDVVISQDDEDEAGVGKERKVKVDPKTLGRPRSTSMNRFAPNVQSEDLGNEIKPATMDRSPLFGPFPMQGRPLLGNGDMMEKSGFKILAVDTVSEGKRVKE